MSKNNPIPVPVWLLSGIAAQRVVRKKKPVGAVRRRVGWALTAASAGLAIWGIQDLQKAETSLDSSRPHDASKLVTGGAHAISRHPVYAGMIGALVGQAIVRGRLLALLPVVAVWLGLEAQSFDEENVLAEKFGRDYLSYQDRVPKWL